MRLRRLSWSGLALVVPLLVACDPGDTGPQLVEPTNSLVPPPPPPPPAEAPVDPSAASNPNGMYASGEYALGDDPDAYDDNDPSALTDFHQTLDAHGTWSDDPTYGTVWLPAASDVGPDFTPYATGGHWAYDSDYVWVSDYDWGWAPFHYGRWVFIDGRGWAWIPGRVYRGAWVSWGVDPGYGYVGWYPMAPAFLWFGGVAVGYGFAIGPRWNYCGRGEIFSPGLGAHLVRGAAATAIAGRVQAVPSVDGASHGPEPSRLGYSAAQIPHPTGAAAAGLAKAQQFSRASTATALGAHAPTRAPTAAMTAGRGRPPLTGGGAAAGGFSSHTMTPGGGMANHGMLPTQPTTPKRKPQPEPQSAPRPKSTYRGGGGHHR